MTMFEVFTKEVEINGEKYRLRPLSGRFIKPFYSLVKSMGSMKEDDEGIGLDPEAMVTAFELTLETFKKSYSNEKEEVLEEFVAQNLVQLLPVIVQLNMPEDLEEASKE